MKIDKTAADFIRHLGGSYEESYLGPPLVYVAFGNQQAMSLFENYVTLRGEDCTSLSPYSCRWRPNGETR